MEDINIQEIIRAENLPLRILKICKKLGINSLIDFIKYYDRHGTFMKSNICGKKTNEELIRVYAKYSENKLNDNPAGYSIKYEENIFRNINIKNVLTKIARLNDLQKTILSNKISLKAGKLPKRSFNAIKFLLHGNFTIENLSTNIFSYNYFNFLKVRNVGKKSIPELNNFIIEIIDELDKVLKMNNNTPKQVNYRLNNEYALSSLQLLFNFDARDYKSISGYYLKNKTFPIFKLLDILINNKYLFNENELLVFNYSSNFSTNPARTIPGLSDQAGLTYERIRQLKYMVLNNFENIFSFVEKFGSLVKYDFFNTSKNFITIDDETTEYLNFRENVHFSKLFYIKIFSIITKKTHTLIGNISTSVKKLKAKKIINQEYFLISGNFSEIFDFDSFIIDILKQIHRRKTKSYSRNFENYLTGFYYKHEQTGIKVIAEICKKILLINFNIIPDSSSGNIIFERNTKKLTYEYLVEILEEFGKPMHYVELFKECIKRGYPVKSDMGVHSTLFNHSAVFGLKGAGIFNLRKNGGYFGTIGNVAEKYLREKGCPIPLKELETFINNEMVISRYSIRMVLFKYKKEGRFILNNKLVSLREWSS